MKFNKVLLLLSLIFLISCSGEHLPNERVFEPNDSLEDPGLKPASMSFQGVVDRIFAKRCFECHGETIQELGVDLRFYENLLEGEPLIVAGDPENSFLFKIIESGKMPDKGRPKVTPEELEFLRQWILAGAPEFEEDAVEPSPFPEEEIGTAPSLPSNSIGSPFPEPIVTTQLVNFERVFREILEPKCARCHSGPLGEAGVDVTDLEALKNNFSFPDLLVKGSPMQSRLYRVVDSGRMPYRSNRLSSAELELIRLWIYEGEDL